MNYLEFLRQFTAKQLETFYSNVRSEVCAKNVISTVDFDEDIQYYIDSQFAHKRAAMVELRAWVCILELTPANQSAQKSEEFMNQLRDRILQGV